MFSREQNQSQSQTFMVSPFRVEGPSQSSSFSLQELVSLRNTMKKNKRDLKRRFSDEQIKSLEYSFKSETRPDTNVKHHLAERLELQPRQVSIWFQNKRARLKGKQIEREFSSLKAEYNDLASSFESLKQENELLLVQLQKLKNIQANLNGSINIEQQHNNERKGEFDDESTIKLEPIDKCGFMVECPDRDAQITNAVDDIINNRNVEKECEEGSGGGLTEDQSACDCKAMASSSHFEYFLDESSCSSQWWELWS